MPPAHSHHHDGHALRVQQARVDARLAIGLPSIQRAVRPLKCRSRASTRACSSFATRANRWRTDKWSASPPADALKRGPQRWPDAQDAGELRGEIALPVLLNGEVAAGEAVTQLALPLHFEARHS